MNTVGWIGAICFALCGSPQAHKSHRDGHSNGLDTSFLLMWTFGEILTLIAVVRDAPLRYLIYNYAANLFFLAVMWKYKIWPRKIRNHKDCKLQFDTECNE
jgi:hypothetical protein